MAFLGLLAVAAACSRPAPSGDAHKKTGALHEMVGKSFEAGCIDSVLKRTQARGVVVDAAAARASCRCMAPKLLASRFSTAEAWAGMDELNYKMREKALVDGFLSSPEGQGAVSECAKVLKQN